MAFPALTTGAPPAVAHGAFQVGSLLHRMLRKAAERTVDSQADLRWGPDRKGFRHLLHPNGVCLTGEWRITAPTEYSGYFATGSSALVVARYSTCCTETRRGHCPSKIFRLTCNH